MLVLSRKISQTVRLPDVGVTVTVADVKGRTVKLGVDAPPSVCVLRGEREPHAGQDAGPPPTAGEAGADVPAVRRALRDLARGLAQLETTGAAGARCGELFVHLARAEQALGRPAAADVGATLPAVVGPELGRTLLVCPDRRARRVMAETLTRWGVDVETVAGPAAARMRLRDAEASPIELILADLPEETGEAAGSLRRLRDLVETGPHGPVRLLAFGAGDLPGRLNGELSDEFSVKPVDPRALAARLQPLALAG